MAPVTSIDQPVESPPPSLDALFRLLRSDLDRVNALIVARMHSPVALNCGSFPTCVSAAPTMATFPRKLVMVISDQARSNATTAVPGVITSPAWFLMKISRVAVHLS